MSDECSFLKREVDEHSSSGIMTGMQTRDLSMQSHKGREDLSTVLKGMD